MIHAAVRRAAAITAALRGGTDHAILKVRARLTAEQARAPRSMGAFGGLVCMLMYCGWFGRWQVENRLNRPFGP
jgi:hypothetical protein